MECDKCFTREKDYIHVRQPGVEPGSTAWEAAMITVTPLSPTRLLDVKFGYLILHYLTVVSFLIFGPAQDLILHTEG